MRAVGEAHPQTARDQFEVLWAGGAARAREALEQLGVRVRHVHAEHCLALVARHAPDMLVLGADEPSALAAAQSLYAPFQTEKVPMDLRSAEMVKHALNAFLATSIGFINEIANVADRLGADAVAVGRALKLDKRIGKSALMTPGLGYSGGTLARDVTQLRKFSKELRYKARLFDAVADVNDDGSVNITDPISLLTFLFGGGAEQPMPPAAPGTPDSPCGPDPEGSVDLGCESYTSCQ